MKETKKREPDKKARLWFQWYDIPEKPTIETPRTSLCSRCWGRKNWCITKDHSTLKTTLQPCLPSSSSSFLALGDTGWAGVWQDLEVEQRDRGFWYSGLSSSFFKAESTSGDSGSKFFVFQDSFTNSVSSLFWSIGITSSGAKATTWILEVR